jgi:hypothetical protein
LDDYFFVSQAFRLLFHVRYESPPIPLSDVRGVNKDVAQFYRRIRAVLKRAETDEVIFIFNYEDSIPFDIASAKREFLSTCFHELLGVTPMCLGTKRKLAQARCFAWKRFSDPVDGLMGHSWLLF